MKLIEPSYQIEQAPPYHDMVATIERAARTCYQSANKGHIEATKLIRSCINRRHESVLEHCVISMRIVCDRGVSHELVRHRLCAFSQESQRYCAYKDEVEFIKPHWYEDEKNIPSRDFMASMWDDEFGYKRMLAHGLPPQDARAVLPNATKTELVITANLREWRHIFKLRCAKAAHPEMRRIMIPMRAEFCNRWPVFFEDLLASEEK